MRIWRSASAFQNLSAEMGRRARGDRAAAQAAITLMLQWVRSDRALSVGAVWSTGPPRPP
jgi:hypothetical protein